MIKQRIALALMPTLLGGCATAMTLSEPTTENKIYSGTVRQIELECAHATCLDFPFSLVADTVLLPITIPWTVVNAVSGKSDATKEATPKAGSDK